MLEFKINEYISLKLEDERTIIYIKKMRFLQCKYLLLNIQTDEIKSLDEFESIDEAAEKLDKSQEGVGPKEVDIPPETEFWGHCSNLQVWYENNYDTRLLHSNLAFPLLKKLTEIGDPLARKVLKDEIIKRYKNGTSATKKFLIIEGFLGFLPLDVRLNLLLDHEDFYTLMDLSMELPPINPLPNIEVLLDCIKIENKRIIELDLSRLDLIEFPISILNFKSLAALNLGSNLLEEIPRRINKLKNLKKLWLSYNKLRYLPNSICSMKNLEQLWLDDNKIRWLPKRIGSIDNLQILSLYNNRLRRLPDSLCRLKNLINLNLTSNTLKELPEKFSELKSLEKLSLWNNKKINLENSLEKIVELQQLKELRIKKINDFGLILNLKKKLKENLKLSRC